MVVFLAIETTFITPSSIQNRVVLIKNTDVFTCMQNLHKKSIRFNKFINNTIRKFKLIKPLQWFIITLFLPLTRKKVIFCYVKIYVSLSCNIFLLIYFLGCIVKMKLVIISFFLKFKQIIHLLLFQTFGKQSLLKLNKCEFMQYDEIINIHWFHFYFYLRQNKRCYINSLSCWLNREKNKLCMKLAICNI